MNRMKIILKYLLLMILPASCWTGCAKLLDVPVPDGKTTGREVFNNKDSATAAVLGIYAAISSTNNPLSGAASVFNSVYVDDLIYTGSQRQINDFYVSNIATDNTLLQTIFWAPVYKYIYSTNACIKGLAESDELTSELKNQLTGECKFLRALLYFNLIRCFGDVPLVQSTLYMENEQMPRTSVGQVENFIIEDLKAAKSLLSSAYPSADRVRANRWCAGALLAEFYLYRKEWALADKEASEVINAGYYHLEDIEKVFLSGSKEAIFQLQPVLIGHNTMEANWLVPSGTGRPVFALTTSLSAAFESGDKRKKGWIGSKTVSSGIYEYVFKYRQRLDFSSNFKLTEFSAVLRLAAIYLARAEARTALGQLPDAINDLDMVRQRAGLPLIAVEYPSIPANELAEKIQHERRVELFAEFGYRLYDLKRTDRINEVMKTTKPDHWVETDTLWPIPASEIMLNPLLLQNKGYK
ncbi:RagB/SusD family nutrient uptake outer membrane protein [Chitinophaga agri]|uniref:RagB/SusD family nutrient uptake outer membrane protein n=1 Tax=Chitinophaga agri TaxID=2703787 RepID=A0A6B9ZCP3_9BACT|nr:RagB/SusD family nutrient uptake outer membrane protein [Chitinophaga agri]QHS58885.1 RagB/SusD family nutrient uptake outer membrane protein [Chitinophaga agri]